MRPHLATVFIATGALAAAAAVILGAVAAHLPGADDAASQPMFRTALQLHQFHALGLLAVGLVAQRQPASRWLAAAGALMVLGLLLFSGNLYLRLLVNIDSFRALTPFGGAAWILAWLALAVGVLRGGR